MGQLIGLAVLILVLYGIGAALFGKGQNQQNLGGLMADKRRAEKQAAELQSKLEDMQNKLDQYRANEHERIQLAYREGFKDGVAQKQTHS